MSNNLLDRDRLHDLIKKMKEEPRTLAILIGAGISRSAGIPLASEIVDSIIQQKTQDLRRIEPGLTEADLEMVFKEHGLFLDPRHNYSDAIRFAYPTRQDRQRFFHSLYVGKSPSPGHRYLAEIIKQGYVDTIFTTNFDPLMENALREAGVLFKTISHDELSHYAEIRGDLVNVIKLHGDFLYSNLKNLEEETRRLSKGLEDVFSNFLNQYGLIVIGFAGNDESVMLPLRQVKEPHFLSRGLYWIYRNLKRSELKQNPLLNDVIKRSAGNLVLIGVEDADDFLKRVHAELLQPAISSSLALIDRTVHNYSLKNLIGKGEFGTVYRGEHVPFGGEKAVKLLESNSIVHKIFECADLISQLGKHPNILDIENCGIENGNSYLLSEYVEINLDLLTRDMLKFLYVKDGEVLAEDVQVMIAVSEIGCQILDALHYAHERGAIHGNLKPTNVLIDRSGQVRITDFVTSRIALELKGKAFFTSAGSLPYIAPELRESNPPTIQMDLYAVGAILYRLLTGKLHSDELVSPYELNQSIPIVLSDIIWRSLKADLLLRYQSAEEMQSELANASKIIRESKNISRREFYRDEIETHVAGICLREESGTIEVLLARRSPSKQVYPNLWDSGGGAIRSGENFEEAVVRELKQELGIIAKPLLPLRTYEIQLAHSRQGKIPGLAFVCEVVGYVAGNQPYVDGKDMVEWRWFPASELDKVELIPSIVEDVRLAVRAYEHYSSKDRAIDEKLEVHVSGVCLRLVDRQIEVLLSKRAMNRRIYPGLWEPGGGAVRAGESFEEALIREFKEELSIVVEPITIVSTYSIKTSNVTQLKIPGVVFLCRVTEFLSGESPIVDTREQDECRWQPLAELDKLEIISNAISDISQAAEVFIRLGLADSQEPDSKVS